MRRRALWSALALTLALVGLAGCGGGNARQLSASQVPLVPGSTIIARVTQCDSGANAYCALALVVQNTRYRNSDQLEKAEHDRIHAAGWRGVGGDTGAENSAESPSHKLRVTYATAYGELQSIDLGLIHRPPAIATALAHTLFAHAPVISILLESGTSS